MEIKLFLGVYLAYKLAGKRRSATEPSGILDHTVSFNPKSAIFTAK
jgi:hypothetical protein